MIEETLANYTLSVSGSTYTGTASIRGDYFDYGYIGAQANSDVLDGIISDESLPIKETDVIDWELTPAN